MSEKINIHLQDGQQELVIRHGQASPATLPRKGININGTLKVVAEHLAKLPQETLMLNSHGDNKIGNSYIEVDREKGSIVLTEDAGMESSSTITGILAVDPRFKDFGINGSKSYTTHELADFIRMNRTFFETKEMAMKLVAELRNFKAKVDKDVELSSNDRGDKRMLLAQKIESNIPESFKLDIPIFKGYPAQKITVEVVVDSGDMSCKLISPDASDFIEEFKGKLIDDELDSIRNLHPNLRVFEI